MTPEKLTLGQPPPEEAAFQRRSEIARRRPVENQETWGIYRLESLVETVLRVDEERWQGERARRKQGQAEILQIIWGKGLETATHISPSTASFCLRWVGYESLGYPPAPVPTKASLAMMMGSSAHYELLRKIRRHVRSQQETSFMIDDLSGRIDLVLRNPRTKEIQVLELKFTGDFGWQKITREKLPPELRSTKGIYWPSPENYKQVLLYMWAQEKQGEKVACANILYINRDSGEIKEALVPWDERSKYDAGEFVRQVKEAKAKIDQGELPGPSVESEHICKSFCRFRTHCEPGRNQAASQVRKKRPRMAPWLRRKIKASAAAKKEKMVTLGVVQPELLTVEKDSKREVKNREPIICADCGGKMVQRGKRQICPPCEAKW